MINGSLKIQIILDRSDLFLRFFCVWAINLIFDTCQFINSLILNENL